MPSNSGSSWSMSIRTRTGRNTCLFAVWQRRIATSPSSAIRISPFTSGEEALMREGIGYKVVGGVRFYERREIKDALAYMRLVINPHDDVSLRRVINVPARGIGKGVMDTLEKVAPATDAGLPLLAAGLQPAVSANSLWARLFRGLEEGAFPA